MKNLLLVMIMGFWCSSAWATEIDAGKACLGRPDGKQKMKDESWSYKYSCKNGKLDGVVITIHKMSGELTSETPFVDGKRNGIQKNYRQENLESELPYENDLLHGVAKMYEGGRLVSTPTYKKGICVSGCN